MANTLTGLIQTIYTSLDVVSRELIGFIPQVNRDARTETAAKGQTISYPETEGATAIDISAAMTIPEGTDQTVGPNTLTINKSRAIQIPWIGEEIKSLSNGGIYSTIQSDQIQQAFRTLVNEMEQDLFNAAVLGASRAVGTAATAPFATANDMSDMANLRGALNDNGAPGGRGLVLSSRGSNNLFAKQSGLFHVNESGDSMFLRQGAMGSIYGFNMGETGGAYTNAAGTGSSYVLDGAVASGDNTISIDTGTGTILAGNIIAIDGVKYVVNTGVTAPGDVVINKPGATDAIDDGSAVTLGASYEAAGVGFSRDGLLLATRLPAMPSNGDAAIDTMEVTDPNSGISFRVALYQGYHKQMIEISAAWGVKAVKPAHIALLLG